LGWTSYRRGSLKFINRNEFRVAKMKHTRRGIKVKLGNIKEDDSVTVITLDTEALDF